MTIDVQKLAQNKLTILEFIKTNGPSLPVKIAKAIDSSPLFTAAFLAELHKEQKLKMSIMRIGSSPLYYLPGQEAQLENFSDYLGEREKQAYLLLQNSKILRDEEQTPVMRVALRSIKDFAIPIKIRINEEVKLCWKYFLLLESEIRPLLKNLPSNSKPLEAREISAQKLETSKLQIPEPLKVETSKIQAIETAKIEKKPIEEIKKQIIQNHQLIPEKQIILEKQIEKPMIQKTKQTLISTSQKPIEKIQKPKLQKQHHFPQHVKSYLSEKDIEVLSSIEEKKKEFTAKVRIDTLLGKQSFLLLAKDKKKITENDLVLALQKSQTEKMPALIVSSGELDKKAQIYIKDWQSLIKFEKINL